VIGIYLKLGFDHILNLSAIDHILFVLTLCAVYTVGEWKKVLILVTAFTIGHSLTLGLSVYDVVHFKPSIVEHLIPITIIFTALINLWNKDKKSQSMNVLYAMACFFGLIHGLGFSNYLKELLGKEEGILVPLLGFNLGVEGGQIIIVACGMLLNYILINVLNINPRYWTVVVSIIAIIVSTYLLVKLG
jgi:ABC-type antimicrobial peptide transport system permease subunit